MGPGPGPERDTGMRNNLEQAPDWVREMLALISSHPTMDWLRPTIGTGPHIAVWRERGTTTPQRAERENLRDLVLYLQAHFRGAWL